MPQELLEERKLFVSPAEVLDVRQAQELISTHKLIAAKFTPEAKKFIKDESNLDKHDKDKLNERFSHEIKGLQELFFKTGSLEIKSGIGSIRRYDKSAIESVAEAKKKIWSKIILLDKYEIEQIWSNSDFDEDLKNLAALSLFGIQRLNLNDDLRSFPAVLNETDNLAEQEVAWRQRLNMYVSRLSGTQGRKVIRDFWQNGDNLFYNEESSKSNREGAMRELAAARFFRDVFNFEVRMPSPYEDAHNLSDVLAFPLQRKDLAISFQIKGTDIESPRQINDIFSVLRQPGSPYTENTTLSKDENRFVKGCKTIEDQLSPISKVAGVWFNFPKRVSTPNLKIKTPLDIDFGRIADPGLVELLKVQFEKELKKIKS